MDNFTGGDMQSQMRAGIRQEQEDKPLEREDRAQLKEDNLRGPLQQAGKLLVLQQDSLLGQVGRKAEEDNRQAVLGSLGEDMLGSLNLQLDNQIQELGIRFQVHQGIHDWGLLLALQVQGRLPVALDMLPHLQVLHCLLQLLHVWLHCELTSLQPAFPSSHLQAEMIQMRRAKFDPIGTCNGERTVAEASSSLREK